tara:strand:+ start:377 stop:517 length:141 start_codon:yes stop_codon:yes gene_type:complete
MAGLCRNLDKLPKAIKPSEYGTIPCGATPYIIFSFEEGGAMPTTFT